MSARLRETEHNSRALEHEKVGRVLAESGHEWAAVALFYGAYHVVKAALLVDAIFDDVGAMHRCDPDLIERDRFTDRHKGRRRPGGGPREWGVNELVQKLYSQIAREYEQLHQASISVRYGKGLPSGALEALVISFENITTERADGGLTAPLIWT